MNNKDDNMFYDAKERTEIDEVDEISDHTPLYSSHLPSSSTAKAALPQQGNSSVSRAHKARLRHSKNEGAFPRPQGEQDSILPRGVEAIMGMDEYELLRRAQRVTSLYSPDARLRTPSASPDKVTNGSTLTPEEAAELYAQEIKNSRSRYTTADVILMEGVRSAMFLGAFGLANYYIDTHYMNKYGENFDQHSYHDNWVRQGFSVLLMPLAWTAGMLVDACVRGVTGFTVKPTDADIQCAAFRSFEDTIRAQGVDGAEPPHDIDALIERQEVAQETRDKIKTIHDAAEFCSLPSNLIWDIGYGVGVGLGATYFPAQPWTGAFFGGGLGGLGITAFKTLTSVNGHPTHRLEQTPGPVLNAAKHVNDILESKQHGRVSKTAHEKVRNVVQHMYGVTCVFNGTTVAPGFGSFYAKATADKTGFWVAAGGGALLTETGNPLNDVMKIRRNLVSYNPIYTESIQLIRNVFTPMLDQFIPGYKPADHDANSPRLTSKLLAMMCGNPQENTKLGRFTRYASTPLDAFESVHAGFQAFTFVPGALFLDTMDALERMAKYGLTKMTPTLTNDATATTPTETAGSHIIEMGPLESVGTLAIVSPFATSRDEEIVVPTRHNANDKDKGKNVVDEVIADREKEIEIVTQEAGPSERHEPVESQKEDRSRGQEGVITLPFSAAQEEPRDINQPIPPSSARDQVQNVNTENAPTDNESQRLDEAAEWAEILDNDVLGQSESASTKATEKAYASESHDETSQAASTEATQRPMTPTETLSPSEKVVNTGQAPSIAESALPSPSNDSPQHGHVEMVPVAHVSDPGQILGASQQLPDKPSPKLTGIELRQQRNRETEENRRNLPKPIADLVNQRAATKPVELLKGDPSDTPAAKNVLAEFDGRKLYLVEGGGVVKLRLAQGEHAARLPSPRSNAEEKAPSLTRSKSDSYDRDKHAYQEEKKTRMRASSR
jgi:hypothetical protein